MQLMWLSGPTGHVRTISITARTMLRAAGVVTLVLVLLGFVLNWVGLRFAVEYSRLQGPVGRAEGSIASHSP
jgi:hypothetical protein